MVSEHVDKIGPYGVTGSFVGWLTASVGALTLNDMLAIGGFMVALISVAAQIGMTWYFKSKHLAISQARLEKDLRDGGGEDDA
jgi:hypothetical protein